MNHAIRRLREERRILEEASIRVDGDPSGEAGGLGAANALLAELRREIAEVDAALRLLAESPAPGVQPEAARVRSERTPRGRRLQVEEVRPHA